MERLANNLIKFLVRHTNVHCDTFTAMLWKFSESETIAYAKKITEARVKCGHFTEEAYRDWYYENEYERDKARWEAMINKELKDEKVSYQAHFFLSLPIRGRLGDGSPEPKIIPQILAKSQDQNALFCVKIFSSRNVTFFHADSNF